MPWWLYPYLVGYAVFTLLWLRDDVRDNGVEPLLIAELLLDGCMVLVALGYWLPSVRALLGSYAPVVFVAGLAWLIISGFRDVRAAWPIKDSAFVQVGTAIGSLLLYGLVCGPLLFWGFSFAVLGATGGT